MQSMILSISTIVASSLMHPSCSVLAHGTANASSPRVLRHQQSVYATRSAPTWREWRDSARLEVGMDNHSIFVRVLDNPSSQLSAVHWHMSSLRCLHTQFQAKTGDPYRAA